MKTKTRFIASITKAPKDTEVAMPWQRGARRAAFIAKRDMQKPVLKRA